MKRCRVIWGLVLWLTGCDGHDRMNAQEKWFQGELRCDFSKDHSTSCLNPLRPASGTPPIDIIAYQAKNPDRFQVHVQLPDGKRFDGPAYKVLVTKDDNNQISNFHITTDEGTLQEMYDLALKLISEWHLDKKDLDQWYKQVKREPDYSYLFVTGTSPSKGYPSLFMEFKHSYVEERPWCLFIEVSW